jgi:formylglycine-generating enzyme required for sulfatase activity
VSDPCDTLTHQIAEIEASLHHPQSEAMSEAIRQLVEQQLVNLRQQRAALVDLRGAQTGAVTMGDLARDALVKGQTEVTGTVHGAAVGVNQGTIQITFGAQPAAPAGAQPGPAPAPAEQIAAQRERLDVHRATLATLLTQQATHTSAYVPPSVVSGIREARAGIQQTKATLHGWGVPVEDLPDDAAEVSPPSAPPAARHPVAPAAPTEVLSQDSAHAPPTPDPAALTRLWRQARTAALTQQWAQAEMLLAQVAARNPTYQDVQTRLAEARRQADLQRRYAALTALRTSDDWDAMLTVLATLDEIQMGYPDPEGHRAWAEGRQRREQQYDAALEAADRAQWDVACRELAALLAETPDDAEARTLLAHAQAKQAEAERRQREEAERRRREHLAPALAQIQAQRFDQALALLEALRTQAPADREAAALVAQIIETPAAPFAERLRAAALAGKVGDPRIPVTSADWHDEVARRNERFGAPTGYWCYVRQGAYRIGGWEPKEQPATIQLPAFWLARYPITVAQYAPFVAEGYGPDAERWWTPQGWQWKTERKRTAPWGWNDPQYSSTNQPVIGVTWYEATAFCNWLTAQLSLAGYEVRLPSEAEWEVAAAYDAKGERRPYPWGDEVPTPELAIYNASKLGRPAPVGCCPRGAAACGVLDMAGNIWEWIASSHKGYPAQSGTLIEDFTTNAYDVPLRGGSYREKRINILCGARNRPHPGFVNLDLRGVRVCLAPRRA